MTHNKKKNNFTYSVQGEEIFGEFTSSFETDIYLYEEDIEVSKELSSKYEETFADFRQQEVVTGSVVGITDRDVLIDIGFKAEGVVSRSEFDQMPDIGENVDVFIRTFEDRRGNMLLSKKVNTVHCFFMKI